MPQTNAFQPGPYSASAYHSSWRTPPSVRPARRVREASQDEPIRVHLLDGARELRFVSGDDLPLVVRALDQAGHVVMVRYDGGAQRLVYYAQQAKLSGSSRLSSPKVRSVAMASGLRSRAGLRESQTPSAIDRRASGSPTESMPVNVAGYEDEGSQQLSRGSVSVTGEAWWAGELRVARDVVGNEGKVAFLQIERHGPPPEGFSGSADVELTLPGEELDAIMTLLTNLVEQAKRDGVMTRNVH